MASQRWLPSSPAAAGAEALTAKQVTAWRSAGVVVLDPGLVPAALVATRSSATPSACLVRGVAPGEQLQFPAASAAANKVTLHPRVLAAAAQLLGVSELSLRLTQSHVWCKRGDPANADADQRIHQ